jgi:hypothetical protein
MNLEERAWENNPFFRPPLARVQRRVTTLAGVG